MCCFTGQVEWVASTNIFARPGRDGNQLLVYSMTAKANDELAMVLPIPVPKQSAEKSVQFIDLKDYPEFFRDMALGFPVVMAAGAVGGKLTRSAPLQPKLEVVDVGNFEASFVPAVADFQRLDARFRFADAVWDELPQYIDWGFAVFKLKPGKPNFHPMAFTFPRANRRQIFFPTVHIHDGKVHAAADFDHTLYFQLSDADYSPKRGWLESTVPARMFMKMPKVRDILDGGLHCYRKGLRGRQKNEDVWL